MMLTKQSILCKTLITIIKTTKIQEEKKTQMTSVCVFLLEST